MVDTGGDGSGSLVRCPRWAASTLIGADMRQTTPATGAINLDLGGYIGDTIDWLTGKTDAQIAEANAAKAQANADAWAAYNAQQPTIPVWVWVVGAIGGVYLLTR